MKPNVKDLSREELEIWLSERGESRYRVDQIRRWLFQKGAASFAEMTNLSAKLRRELEGGFAISRLRVARSDRSADGTVKLLFSLDDGYEIESVLIPETKRLTLCISTQAGCGLGCAFCATALLGLKRNLTAAEIVDQILKASRAVPAEQRITHIVLMGMGEPLANYAQTVRAIAVMTDGDSGLGFSSRRVTLSTVGLVPQIKKLIDETQVNLAISLHATTDEVRSRLMPVNRKYPLEELTAACEFYQQKRGRMITFEYILIAGVNDGLDQVAPLAKLARTLNAKVNLIPYNKVEDLPWERPSEEVQEAFLAALEKQKVTATLRREKGHDIDAACGQLRLKTERELANANC